MFTSQFQARLDFLENEQSKIRKLLHQLPEGRFFATKNGKYFKWYNTPDSQSAHYTLLSQKERSLAEKLAIRKYLQLVSTENAQQINTIQHFLKNWKTSRSSDQLLADPRYQDLLASYFAPHDSFVENWQAESFEGNPYHPEQLIHKTAAGYMVRSKSEQFISLILSRNQIPHRYEAPLLLGKSTIYPDFTLLHPETHEFFYLEHFGMMDDPAYAAEANRKIQRYIQNGIYPNQRLIITSETQDHPLNPEFVDHLIQTILYQ